MLNNQYFASIIRMLNQHEVKYVLIKGNNQDSLHIWVGAEADNKNRLIGAIEESGIDALVLALSKPQPLPVELPQGQMKLEVLHSIDNYTFHDAYLESEEISWGDEKVKSIPAVKGQYI